MQLRYQYHLIVLLTDSLILSLCVSACSDETNPAGGGLSPGRALSVWDAEHPDSSGPQPPRSPPPHQPSSPLLPSLSKVEYPAVAHHSERHDSPSSHQGQARQQHFPAVLASAVLAADYGHAEQRSPTDHQRQTHNQDQDGVSLPATLQLVDPTPTVHTVHVLDGRAEELLEQNNKGQEAKCGAHPKAPLPRQTGGGGQEAHTAEAQPHYKGHWGTVAQQGVTWFSEPPQLHLIFQDVSLDQSGIQVVAWRPTEGVEVLVERLHLRHGSGPDEPPPPLLLVLQLSQPKIQLTPCKFVHNLD